MATLGAGSWTQTVNDSQGFINPYLNGVWCSTVTSCIAVGSIDQGEPSGSSPLIEAIINGMWTPTTAGLLPAGAQSGLLTAISCLSTAWCEATGSYTDGSGDTHALFETFSGTSWSPMTATDPNGATNVSPQSLQCFSPTSCLAVGVWGPTNTSENGLLETLSGSTWTASTLQSGVDVRSLWCASAASCLAVGVANSGTEAGVTETLSGGSWTSGIIPGLSDGGTPNGIVAVSCVTAITSCVAIGGWRPPAPNSSEPLALVETLGNGTWAPDELPATSGDIFPEALSCPTLVSCVGVGSDIAASQTPAAITESVLHGYWLVGSDGGIFTFGKANFFGSTGSLKLNRPVVGITPTVSELGYWLVASDGGIFAFGDAPFVGSIPGLGLNPAGSGKPHSLNAPIVGMVPSSTGAGYFMVASDGGVFAFGDAAFEGSCPGQPGGCLGAAVGVAPDASGQGYWLVTQSGHVYTFGDATYFGAPGPQSTSITSIVRTADGGGYWVLDAAGSVFAYGDAAYLGGLPAGATSGGDPASAIFTTSDGGGYWVATALGKVYPFGDAPADGDMSATNLNGAIIAATGF
jgi:hypothetical protein